MRLLVVLIFVMMFMSLYGQYHDIEDSVSCIILKKEKVEYSNLSRTQFVMSADSLCIVRHIPYERIDSMIHNLSYVGNLDYFTDQFAMDWVVYSDSIISLESISPPVIGLIIVYNINTNPKKYYFDKHINSLIWITKETVEIGNKKFALSRDLKELLF